LAAKKKAPGDQVPQASAAKPVVAAAGKITSGAMPEAPPTAKSAKKAKLLPKHKSRLPRRQKKALRKAAASD
jgi:hypothetical protein